MNSSKESCFHERRLTDVPHLRVQLFMESQTRFYFRQNQIHYQKVFRNEGGRGEYPRIARASSNSTIRPAFCCPILTWKFEAVLGKTIAILWKIITPWPEKSLQSSKVDIRYLQWVSAIKSLHLSMYMMTG